MMITLFKNLRLKILWVGEQACLERRSIYSISILLLEFIFPFVRPSEYILIPEVCAQGWYSGSTPVLFVEFGSFFLTFFFIYSSHFCTFLANLQILFVQCTDFFFKIWIFFSIFVATDVYALPLKFEHFRGSA